MKTISSLLLALLAGMPLPAQTVRVGTFHHGSIVVAFVRSRLFADSVMNPKLQEMEKAKQSGDTKKVAELKAWGGAHQERVHEQLAGERPIDDIVAALAPAFPEIAKKANVALIAADLPYTGGNVETVDVTEQILDWLKSDDATRKIVHELQQLKGPVHLP
jgi:hypothetical protein